MTDRMTTAILALGLLASVGPPAEAQLRLDPRPVITIRGRVGNLLQFAEAVGASRLPDGRIAVADGPEGTIRFFSPGGDLLSSFGRRGRGPGEFQQLSGLGRCRGDTLALSETFAQRITLITGAGQEVRRLQGLAPLRLACSGAGVLAVLRQAREEPPPGATIQLIYAPLSLADATGRVIRELGRIPVMEVALLDGQWNPRPLGPATTLAAGGGRIYVGTGDSARVVVFSDAGERLPPVQVGARRRSVRPAHVDAAIAALVWPLPEGLREPMGAKFRRIALPRELPAYHAVYATASGELWVQTSFPGDAETSFEVFDSRGRPLGRATLPFEVRVFDVGDGYLLAGLEDAEGEPSVSMFHVRR